MGVVDAEFMPDAEPKAMNVSDSLLMSMSMSVAHYIPRTLPSPPGHLLNLAAQWASCDVYANMSSLGHKGLGLPQVLKKVLKKELKKITALKKVLKKVF